jgi:hypothetical protein
MPGVLDSGGPPPAPLPNAGQSIGPQNGALSAPSMPSPPIAPGQGQQGQVAPIPTPTHGQTVAVLRHMDAIQRELEALLKDPAVGKSNIKSKIIDGMAKLVASRIITAGNAVGQLGDVPEAPFQQRKWLQKHLLDAVVAKVAVLGHHAKAFGGQPESQIDKTSSPDDHLADMAAVHGQYGGARA